MSERPGPAPAAVRPRTDEGGVALIWALFFVSLTTGILVAHSIEMSANRRTMDTRYRRVELVQQVAASGLTDATSYLRRQTIQPVATFAPQLDLEADPPINDTLDPSIGLVREFEVHGNLWGRYEVRNDEAFDISDNYAKSPGSVWDVGARGYLYEVVDPQVAYDEKPNRILSVTAMRTEIRGFAMSLPADAAIVIPDPDRLTMLGNSVVTGDGGIAVAYQKPTQSAPAPTLGAAVTGSPVTQQIIDLDLGIPALFGMREDRLRGFADVVLQWQSPRRRAATEDHSVRWRESHRKRRPGSRPRRGSGRTSAQMIREINDLAVYSPKSLTLAANGLSLRGRMLLAINGDLQALEGNDSSFNGVVYVKGDAVIQGPFTFRGTMIVGGSLTIGGSADNVHISAAPDEVTAIQNALSRYRISRDSRPMSKAGAFADPEDLEADMNLGSLK